MNLKKYSSRLPLPFLMSTATLLAVAACSVASADIITLVGDNASNESWNTAGDWSDGLTVTTNQDYDTNGFLLRSPNTPTWASTFPTGSTLTIQDTGGVGGAGNGALVIKSGTLNMGDVFIGAGGVAVANANNGSNVSSTFNGDNLTILSSATSVAGSAAILKGGFTGNHLAVNFTNLLGSGYLSIGETGPNSINYSLDIADASGFSGIMHLDTGNLSLASGLTITSGDFTMETSDNTLNFGGNNLSVASFSFGGTSLSADTYSSSQLNTLLSTAAFSGAGSLIVIPEPATSAFVFGGLALLMGLSRRSRQSK